MVVKNVGLALRYCIPQMVGQKIGNFWVIDTNNKRPSVLQIQIHS